MATPVLQPLELEAREPHDPGVVELDGRCTLEHTLGAELSELARLKTRRQLLRSGLYRRLAPDLERVSFGLEYACTRSASEPPGASAESPEGVRVMAWNIQRGTRLDGIADAL